MSKKTNAKRVPDASASHVVPGSGRAQARRKHSIEFTAPSMTHQSFKDECEINNIVDKYTRTGILTHLKRGEPQYGDAPDQTFFEAACVHAEIRSSAELAAGEPESPQEAPEPPETGSDPENGENPLQGVSDALAADGESSGKSNDPT